MELNKLICLNDGSPTFIHNGNASLSWLDIALVSDHMVPSCEWEVLNELNSDHSPVLTQYNVGNIWNNLPTTKPKWNLSKANWPLFTSLCKDINIKDCKSNNIDTYNDNLIDNILMIADKSIPKVTISNRTKSVPWWSNELK